MVVLSAGPTARPFDLRTRGARAPTSASAAAVARCRAAVARRAPPRPSAGAREAGRQARRRAPDEPAARLGAAPAVLPPLSSSGGAVGRAHHCGTARAGRGLRAACTRRDSFLIDLYNLSLYACKCVCAVRKFELRPVGGLNGCWQMALDGWGRVERASSCLLVSYLHASSIIFSRILPVGSSSLELPDPPRSCRSSLFRKHTSASSDYPPPSPASCLASWPSTSTRGDRET